MHYAQYGLSTLCSKVKKMQLFQIRVVGVESNIHADDWRSIHTQGSVILHIAN